MKVSIYKTNHFRKEVCFRRHKYLKFQAIISLVMIQQNFTLLMPPAEITCRKKRMCKYFHKAAKIPQVYDLKKFMITPEKKV